jgi:DNA polymerase-3 subunit alpha
MGKKKPEVMAQQKEVFVEGALGLGVDEEMSGGIFDLMAFFAGYGFNKCVVGETSILDATTGERTTVGELFASRRPFMIHALGEDGALRPREVTDVMWNGVKPVYALETAQGKRIVATGNHPFKTFGGWTNLEDLSVGDRIAAPRALDVPSSTLWDDREVVTLAWLLSEGNTCHPTCLYFYNNVEESVDDFVQATSVFEDTVARVTTRDGGRMEVCLSTGRDTKFAPGHVPWNASGSVALDVTKQEPVRSGAYMWAQDLGILGLKAHEKHVPGEVFTLADEQIALFLGRLWAGDGFFANATQAVPFYATSSERLARDVQHLLNRLGILSGVHSKSFKYRGGERPGYTVHLFGDGSRERFLELVCPHAVGRDDAVAFLESHVDASPKVSFKDTIPVAIRDRVRELKSSSGKTWKQLEAETGMSMKDFTGAKVNPKKKGFRRQSIEALADYFGDDVLMNAATSDVFWDEVVSIEYVGEQDTYDLTVDVDHNFVADGLIVHNSHSAAYALITYQTAYLKKHFEVEFMAALMTNDRDNTDKVVRFINEAKAMNIEVLPPDVNKSQLDFSVVDGQIRFGMAGIKGVGAGVIETLLEARETGPFKSLYDFCARVDSKKINKRTIEALVKSGAFDAIGPSAGSRYIGDHCAARATMLEAIPLALERGKKMQQDEEVGQSSLFGMLSAPAREEALEETYPDATPWPDKELLGYERHLIGFYVTGHPLDRFDDEIAIYGVSATADVHYCKGFQYRDDVTVAGVISEYRERPLKSGNGRMAFLTLEDKTGQCEVLVFSAAFAENEEALKSGEPILIRGQYTEDGDLDGRVGKVRAAEVVRLIDARKRFVRKVRVELEEADITNGQIGELKEIFAAHPGGCAARITLKIPHEYGAGLAELALPQSFNVEPNDELLTQVERLFRKKVVRLGS